MFAEHPSILAALRVSGLVFENHQGRVLLAWSDPQMLALKPIAAVLDIPGTRLVQLPVSLSELKTALSDAQDPQSSCLGPNRLDTTLGQLKWSLSAFSSDLSSGSSDVAGRRLLEIQRFCDENWPGWFSRALLHLHKSCALAQDEVTSSIDALAEYADSVATFDVFRPFLHGAPKDIVNSALGACSALMRYALTGREDIDQESLTLIRDMLNADDWWRSLASSLDDIADRLAESGASGKVADEVLDQVARVNSSAPSLIEFLESLAEGKSPTATEIAPAYEALDALIQLIVQIESRSTDLRSEFEERFGYA